MNKLTLLLVLVLALVSCTQEEDICNCELTTYEYFVDGAGLKQWKVYSVVPISCTDELRPTDVHELDNGVVVRTEINCN